MRIQKVVKIVAGVALFALVFIAGFGSAVQQLWNALMPDLFGLRQIGFWQAVGLLSLSWLLFGGWRGLPRGGRHRGGGMRERWAGLTPEQRERLARGMKHACRGAGSPAPADEPAS